jgi:hypothetical protein
MFSESDALTGLLDMNIFTIAIAQKGPQPACGERMQALMRCVEKEHRNPPFPPKEMNTWL